MSNLNTDKLADALLKLRHKGGGMTWVEINQASGVHNLSRIANKETRPTLESWQRLHAAFPTDIPPPSTLDGQPIIYNHIRDVHGDAMQTVGTLNINKNDTPKLTPEVTYLLKLVTEHGSPAIIKHLIKIMEEEKAHQEKYR